MNGRLPDCVSAWHAIAAPPVPGHAHCLCAWGHSARPRSLQRPFALATAAAMSPCPCIQPRVLCTCGASPATMQLRRVAEGRQKALPPVVRAVWALLVLTAALAAAAVPARTKPGAAKCHKDCSRHGQVWAWARRSFAASPRLPIAPPDRVPSDCASSAAVPPAARRRRCRHRRLGLDRLPSQRSPAHHLRPQQLRRGRLLPVPLWTAGGGVRGGRAGALPPVPRHARLLRQQRDQELRVPAALQKLLLPARQQRADGLRGCGKSACVGGRAAVWHVMPRRCRRHGRLRPPHTACCARRAGFWIAAPDRACYIREGVPPDEQVRPGYGHAGATSCRTRARWVPAVLPGHAPAHLP